MSWMIIYLDSCVATEFKRPTSRHDGQPYSLRSGLASDGVYNALSVTRQAVSSYLAFSPLPVKDWRYVFCCTFLGVTSTGRYPASCPTKPGLSSPGIIPAAIIYPTRMFIISQYIYKVKVCFQFPTYQQDLIFFTLSI